MTNPTGKLNLNLFRILTAAEQEAQQEYADIERWRSACQALGATPDQLAAYERAAQAYAITTLYPNSQIMAAARRAAKDALLMGNSMPTDPEAAVQALWADELRRMIGEK